MSRCRYIAMSHVYLSLAPPLHVPAFQDSGCFPVIILVTKEKAAKNDNKAEDPDTQENKKANVKAKMVSMAQAAKAAKAAKEAAKEASARNTSVNATDARS